MKIDFILGTRPEGIKLAIPIKKFKDDAFFDVRVISTGQHKEMLKQIFDWFDIKPDFELSVMRPNQTLERLSSAVITELSNLYQSEGAPDWVVVQGDTTTAFCGALTAFYKKIKVAHVEAGLRTFNKKSPWPEEANRQLISRITDIHFAPTKANYENLLKEGIKAEDIFITGNTVIDALMFSVECKNELKNISSELLAYFTGAHSEARIVLITGHRRENFGDGFIHICNAIKALATEFPDVHFIYPVHLNPNVRSIVNEILGSDISSNLLLIDPLNYEQFVALMQRSFLILTDSGGVQEEAPSLGKPVLVMRDTTERPEAVEGGTVRLVGTSEEAITSSVRQLLTDDVAYNQMSRATNPYGDGGSTERMIKVFKSTLNE